MIWLAAYEADEPEGSRGVSGQYMSRKDVVWIVGIVAVLAVMAVPLYRVMKEESDKTGCKRNLSAISKSIQQYAEVYDGRYPPIYTPGENGAPSLFEGKPVTWASVIPELSSGASFRCPAAEDIETVRVSGASFKRSMFQPEPERLDYIELTYGMFAPLGMRAVSDVAIPTDTVLLADTTNNGAKGVYNPKPFTLADGTPVETDAFSIGFNDSELSATPESTAVTRLAFFGTADGNFDKESITSRHKGQVFAIFADGHFGVLSPDRATLSGSGNTWKVR